jgi:secreted trypsin-like serine protease
LDKDGHHFQLDLGSDACQGDSGGPLLKWVGTKMQRAFLIGIVSRGEGCGQKNKAGNYKQTDRQTDTKRDTNIERQTHRETDT